MTDLDPKRFPALAWVTAPVERRAERHNAALRYRAKYRDAPCNDEETASHARAELAALKREWQAEALVEAARYIADWPTCPGDTRAYADVSEYLALSAAALRKDPK